MEQTTTDKERDLGTKDRRGRERVRADGALGIVHPVKECPRVVMEREGEAEVEMGSWRTDGAVREQVAGGEGRLSRGSDT